MIKKVIDKLIHKLAIKLYYQNRRIAKNLLPKFGRLGKETNIDLPFQIDGSERIYIGDNVKIGPGSMLRAQSRYPGGKMKHPEGEHREQFFDSNISIGNRVTATGTLQVVAFEKITIEDDVMFASNIFICDGFHCYERTDVPYKYQGITGISPITVEYGSWIGQNVVIMPGVTVGKMSIIGANSVVTRDIPPRCIAVGVPAKVIKRWNEKERAWEKVTQEVSI